jgi:N-acyl-D-amino-acid deacylase
MLIHSAHNRSRGPRLPLEMMLRRQDLRNRDFLGSLDPGAAGRGCDAAPPYLAVALRPANERAASGAAGRCCLNTFVSGEMAFEDGVFTGAAPGGLVRASA